MTLVGRPAGGGAETVTAAGRIVHQAEDWVLLLSSTGADHDDAVRRLHGLMLRAARHQVAQMHPTLPPLGGVRIDDIINQAADEATVSVLRRLPDFEGRSQFTTWAYKFGILHASVEVRRNMWRHREIALDDTPEPSSAATSPEQYVEATQFGAAVSEAISRVLTPHQQRVVLALLVDLVPIDVLAERLGTTRNALYKTLHDARGRLRRDLLASGYLTPDPSKEVR